jgi:myo-inositol-1(or 4)-monophosphatase
MTKKELGQAVKFASSVARGAGQILKKGITGNVKVQFKGRINPVTEFDFKSEKYIVSKLRKKFPDHSIMTEEGGGKDENSDFVWVIDPLDGTVNYSHNLPVYGVSIALCKHDKPILGVVYDPERDELFSAADKLGAFLNGKKIKTTSERQLGRSLLSTGFSYKVRTLRPNNLGLFARMVKTAQAVRRGGSAALDLAWLACGRFDGMWEFDLAPWDSAAGIVLIKEAGGKISRIDGKQFSIFDSNIMASNGLIHKQLQTALNNTRKHK